MAAAGARTSFCAILRLKESSCAVLMECGSAFASLTTACARGTRRVSCHRRTLRRMRGLGRQACRARHADCPANARRGRLGVGAVALRAGWSG